MRPGALVHQTTTGTGTGNLALIAENGKQPFADAYGAGQFDYYISNRNAFEWEWGRGVLSGGQLQRTTPVKSSAGVGTPCNFTAGIKDVASDYPADGIDNASLAMINGGLIKGRVAGAAGDVQDLTAAQVRAIINVADGANAYVHPNHSGDVTSVGDGAQTIANNAVTNAKLADMPAGTIKARSAGGAGDPEDLTAAATRALLNVADGANAYIHPNHTGQVTSVGDGPLTIAAQAVVNSKLADMPEFTFKARAAGGGVPQDLTVAAVKAILATSTADISDIASGFYGPSVVINANLASAVFSSFGMYFRVGTIVVVAGKMTADATTAGVLCDCEINLPLASNFNNVLQAAGSFSTDNASKDVGRIEANVTTKKLRFLWTPTNAGAQAFGYVCAYQLLS